MSKKSKKKSKKARAAVNLIVSERKVPKVELRPGMRFEVTAVTVVDERLTKPITVGARLCGGSGTCLALIDLDVRGDPVP
ncbi:MAG TPA: hypothetical protein ENJ21_05410 [Chromatiaceae bacterium]|nr:hypothetical protein [Chromatiaceae bacterium]